MSVRAPLSAALPPEARFADKNGLYFAKSGMAESVEVSDSCPSVASELKP